MFTLKSTLRLPHTLTLFLLAAAFAHGFTGSGTEDSPYLIETTADMAQLAADVNSGTAYSGKYFRLENNLDFSNVTQDENGNNYTPIGIYGNKYNGFSGTFDGNGKTISGIKVADESSNNGVGIFGYVFGNATIKNLKVENSSFSGNDHVGAIAGYSYGTVENVYVDENTTIGTSNLGSPDSHGGIVGTINDPGSLNASVSKASVTCAQGKNCQNFGGIVGNISGGSVRNNLYLGSQVQGTTVGWIAGNKTAGSSISKNFYPRTLTGSGGIGGTDLAGAEKQHTVVIDDADASVSPETPTSYSNGIEAYSWGVVYDGQYFYQSNAAVPLSYDFSWHNEHTPDFITGYSCTGTGCEISGAILTVGTGDANGVTHVNTITLGSGTEDDPFQIPDSAAWNLFAQATNYNHFYDQYLKLTNDITVSTMACNKDTSNYVLCFAGTFDGNGKTITLAYGDKNNYLTENYAAPFRVVAPNQRVHASIKDLHTAGHIYTSGKFAAGIIAAVSREGSKVEIENCHSSVSIHSNVNGNGSHGGLVGTVLANAELTIKDSYFDGSLYGSNTTHNGGLIGLIKADDYAKVTLSNCMFDRHDVTMSEDNSMTLYRTTSNNGYVTYSDCYYTAPYGGIQGTKLYQTPSGAGTLNKPITAPNGGSYYIHASQNPVVVELYYTIGESPITPLPTSVKFDETELVLNTDYTVGYIKEGSSTETGNITEAGNYTMVIHGTGIYGGETTASIFVIGGEGTETSPYQIATSSDWDHFAQMVNAGKTFEGEYVELTTDDVTASTTVGDAEAHYFAGIFDGGNHTIKANITADGSKQGTSLLRYIRGATIRNLTVTGTITGISGQISHTAGLVGFAWDGVNTIENVTVSATVQNGNHAGGFVGHGKASTIIFRNCVFSGIINFGSQYAGGFLGWNGSNLTIDNCLFKGKFITSGNGYHPLAIKNGGWDVAVSANKAYYTTPSGGSYLSGHVVVDGERVYTNYSNDLYTKVLAADNGYYYIAKAATVSVNPIYESGTLAGNVTPVVKIGNQTLANETDYTFAITKGGTPIGDGDAMDGGSYTVTVTGTGETYYGTKTTTFRVIPAIAVVSTEGRNTAYINGLYNGEDAINISSSIQVDTVVFNRTFSTAGYSTIMLPFTIDTGKVDGLVHAYEFHAMGYDENNKKQVQMAEVGKLDANTPYIIEVNNETLVFHGGVNIEKTKEIAVTRGAWEFRGTLQKKVWSEGDPDLGHVYGYSAEATEKVNIGQFVKAAAGAWIRPLRAYLILNTGNSNAKSAVGGSSLAELPETMDVVLVDRDSNGEVSKKVIGTVDTRTGEFRLDRWYDMQGRKLNGKPTAKGTYYHNGKSVTIK